MQRAVYAAAGIVVASASYAPVHAQQPQVEWKQTLNTPKGWNLPKDVKGEILGIELGDTYAEAKPKLEKLLAEAGASPKAAPRSTLDQSSSEMSGESSAEPITETKTEMRMQTPGGFVSATYVSEIIVRRTMQASTKDKLREIIKVRFSAPSSGHQVTGIDRYTAYPAQTDQPLVSDIVGSLKAKFKADPKPLHYTTTGAGIYFDNGQVYVPQKPETCFPQYEPQGNLGQFVQQINQNGRCDIIVSFVYQPGISANHVSSFHLVLSDNERTKANLTADLTFLNNYVRDLQNNVRGAAPKL